MTSKRVLAFDIGIKNLAWCCGDISTSNGTKHCMVRGWANENLVTGGTAETDKEANKCSLCHHKAGFWHQSTGTGYCVRHCPPLTPALRDLSGNLLKKIPKINLLRELVDKEKAEKGTKKNKNTILAFLQTKYCLPKQPGVAVKKLELEDIHNAIQDMVSKHASLFETCDEILLENQPVLKNPVMKSVQMMLFATLRDLLEGPPKIRLVHAGRKTEGATAGDEGYSERKSMSENRVSQGFLKGTIQMGCTDGRKMSWFEAQTKKSDLADCLSMVIDCPV
jgi:hypothetical protein